MKFLNIIYALSSIALLVGMYFKFNDISNGSILILSGMFVGVITAVIHYIILQRKIEDLEKEKN